MHKTDLVDFLVSLQLIIDYHIQFSKENYNSG